MENRFKMLTKSDPERARVLFKQAQTDAEWRFKRFEYLTTWKPNGQASAAEAASPQQA
jgi:pyruvate-ferredoxin/flavodoxin oxidoreductase